MNTKYNKVNYYKNRLLKYPWISSYYNAHQRCNNPKNKDYKNYGDKGIKFCLSYEDMDYLWNRDKAWLLKQPSIDRKDNNGHYILENCQFIELSENSKKAQIFKKKVIIQYSLDNIFIKEWESITYASSFLNLDASNIVKTLNNKRKSCGGYIWRYKI